jgi:hypothetical protein
MPYPNMPKSKWDEMERCVAHVKAKGGVKNPYAICHASIMGKKKKKDSEHTKKALKRIAKKK